MEVDKIVQIILICVANFRIIHGGQIFPKKPSTFEECTENLKTMKNFSMGNFSGKWYELYAYPFCLSRNAKCVTSFYTQLQDNKVQIYTKLIENYRLPKKFISFGDMKEEFLVQESNPFTGEIFVNIAY